MLQLQSGMFSEKNVTRRLDISARYVREKDQITLLSVEVALFSSTAAAEIWAELVRITSQPTGGTGLTAQNQHNDGSFIDIRRNGTGGAAEAK